MQNSAIVQLNHHWSKEFYEQLRTENNGGITLAVYLSQLNHIISSRVIFLNNLQNLIVIMIMHSSVG